MAEVFREDFDTLADGLEVTATNTAFDSDGGDGTREADTAHSVTGRVSCAMICASITENVRLDWSFIATDQMWFRWYFRPPDPLSLANEPLIANIASGATSQADVRIENDGTLSIRESLAEVAQTTTAVVPGEWHRLEWAFDGTDQILRLFLPTNLHGTAPDEEISDPYGAGTFDTFTIGPFAQADAWTHHVDSIVADDAGFVGAEDLSQPFPDARFELQLGDTWTDITDRVYTRDPVTITRGRSDEAGQTEPSTCSLTLNNRDGRFSPRNPRSPLFGLIGRNTPIRVSVDHGDNVLLSPGVHQRDRVDTPDSAVLSVTGDIDIRIDLTVHNWHGVDLAAKYLTTGDQRSWVLVILTTGEMQLLWSPDGTLASRFALTSTVPVPPTPGRQALRVTLDVDNGATGHTATFYTAPDMTGPWTQLGEAVTGSGITSIFDSTADVEVGEVAGITGSGVDGRIHAFELRDGIDGIRVASPDFSVPAAGSESFFDGQGNTWTVRGEAQITNRWYRFTGEVSEWPPRWDVTGRDIYVPLEAAGILRRLGQGASPLDSAIRRELASPDSANAPVAYWPMEDGRHADSIASGLDSGRPMTVTGNPRMAANTDFVASKPLPTMGDAIFKGRVMQHDATTEAQVRWLLSIPDDGATAGSIIASIDTTGSARRWEVVYEGSDGALRLRAFDDDETNVADTGVLLFGIDGRPIRMSVELQQVGSDVEASLATLPTDQFTATATDITATGHTMGRVMRVSLNPDRALTDVAAGHVSVQSAITVIQDLMSFNAHTGETSGERITRLADEEGLTLRTVGALADPPQLGPQTPTRLVDLLAEAAASDTGVLFEPRDVIGVGFRAHRSLYNQGLVVTLDYAAGQVSPPLEPTDDDQQTVNDVTASTETGPAARFVAETGTLSVTEVGRYDADVTVSANHGEWLGHHAGWRVRLGTVDEARYPSITAQLHGLRETPDLIGTLLSADAGDRLVIDNPPEWLPPEQISQIVQGYSETVEARTHTVTYVCSPESAWRVAEYDDDDRYGSSASHIGFPVVAGDQTTAFATATTSHLVAMPATVASGDLLLVLFSAFGDANTPAIPSGWSEIFAAADTTFGSYAIASRTADGSEGGTTVDFVTPTAAAAAAIAIRVIDCDPSEVAVSTGASSTGGTEPDPDEVTPSWGSDATLWLATAGWYDDDVAVDTFSAEYGGGVHVVSGAGTDAGAATGYAYRERIAASEDPGPYVLASAEAWNAVTLGVRPETTAVDSSATSLSVATTSGPLWTTDAGEFPFDLMVGGERMTVTAITGTTSPQTFAVTRSVNGIVKDHPAGTAVELFAPAYRAL